jgi:hypothetical protein
MLSVIETGTAEGPALCVELTPTFPAMTWPETL